MLGCKNGEEGMCQYRWYPTALIIILSKTFLVCPTLGLPSLFYPRPREAGCRRIGRQMLRQGFPCLLGELRFSPTVVNMIWLLCSCNQACLGCNRDCSIAVPGLQQYQLLNNKQALVVGSGSRPPHPCQHGVPILWVYLPKAHTSAHVQWRWKQHKDISLCLICLVYYSPRTWGDTANMQCSGSINDGCAVVLDNITDFCLMHGIFIFCSSPHALRSSFLFLLFFFFPLLFWRVGIAGKGQFLLNHLCFFL